MQFTRIALRAAAEAAFEADKQAHDDYEQKRVDEHQAAEADWVEQHSEAWLAVLPKLREKLRKGRALTSADLPIDHRRHRNAIAIFDASVPRPRSYTGGDALCSLVRVLDTVADDTISTHALIELGVKRDARGRASPREGRSAGVRVYMSQSFSQIIEVDAKTVDEAIEKASNEAYFGLCHQCSHEMSEDGDTKALYVYDDADNVIWRAKPETASTSITVLHEYGLTHHQTGPLRKAGHETAEAVAALVDEHQAAPDGSALSRLPGMGGRRLALVCDAVTAWRAASGASS